MTATPTSSGKFSVGDRVVVKAPADWVGFVWEIVEFDLKKKAAKLRGITDPQGEDYDDDASVFIKSLHHEAGTPRSTPAKTKASPGSSKKRPKAVQEDEDDDDEETQKKSKASKGSAKKKASPATKKVKKEESPEKTPSGRPR